MRRCSRGRLVLAAYLDLLLFSTVALLAVWLLARVGLSVPWYVLLVLFALLDFVLHARDRSPGAHVLGIVRTDRGRAVLPAWHARERWWTLLVGALGMLSGAKEAVRWTQGLPPPPFMGLTLSWDMTAAIVTTSGLLTMFAGLGVLATRAWGALLGIGLSVLGTASWLVSWAQIPAWVEARTIAQRALQGLPVRPGEVARMQWMLPGGALFGSCVGALWLLCAWLRFRRLDALGQARAR